MDSLHAHQSLSEGGQWKSLRLAHSTSGLLFHSFYSQHGPEPFMDLFL